LWPKIWPISRHMLKYLKLFLYCDSALVGFRPPIPRIAAEIVAVPNIFNMGFHIRCPAASGVIGDHLHRSACWNMIKLLTNFRPKFATQNFRLKFRLQILSRGSNDQGYWPIFYRSRTKIFDWLAIFGYLANFSIFDENWYILAKFRLLTKNFDICSKYSVFGQYICSYTYIGQHWQ